LEGIITKSFGICFDEFSPILISKSIEILKTIIYLSSLIYFAAWH